MNATKLIQSLGAPKTAQTIKHATTLLNIYKILDELNVVTVEQEQTEILFGRETRSEYRFGEWKKDAIYEGFKASAVKLTITTDLGRYVATVPCGELLDMFKTKLGLNVEQTVKPEIIETVTLSQDITQQLKTAAKFRGKDDMRPVMKHVLIEFGNGLVRVVGVDGHKLYWSKKIECSFAATKQFLITGEFSKLKKATEIHILTDDKIMIDGLIFDCFTDGKFPNYNAVIPEYETYISCDKKELMQAVKQAALTTNKTTHKVNLYMNGSISVSGEDVDFSNEGAVNLMYKIKTFDDCTIGFNAKLLLECLSSIESTEVIIKTNGKPTKSVVIPDAKGTVLLMPLE